MRRGWPVVLRLAVRRSAGPGLPFVPWPAWSARRRPRSPSRSRGRRNTSVRGGWSGQRCCSSPGSPSCSCWRWPPSSGSPIGSAGPAAGRCRSSGPDHHCHGTGVHRPGPRAADRPPVLRRTRRRRAPRVFAAPLLGAVFALGWLDALLGADAGGDRRDRHRDRGATAARASR